MPEDLGLGQRFKSYWMTVCAGEGKELKSSRKTSALADDALFARLASPLFLEFIVTHSLQAEMESSDRRIRNTG